MILYIKYMTALAHVVLRIIWTTAGINAVCSGSVQTTLDTCRGLNLHQNASYWKVGPFTNVLLVLTYQFEFMSELCKQILPRGVGVTLPRGVGVTLPRGVGVTLPRGAGVTLPRGVGVTLPRGVGVTLPRGVGVTLPRGVGVTLPRGVGVTLPRGVGVTLPRGVGVTLPRGMGVTLPRGVGVTLPRGVGVTPVTTTYFPLGHSFSLSKMLRDTLAFVAP